LAHRARPRSQIWADIPSIPVAVRIIVSPLRRRRNKPGIFSDTDCGGDLARRGDMDIELGLRLDSRDDG
jgi:hypothetical protein